MADKNATDAGVNVLAVSTRVVEAPSVVPSDGVEAVTPSRTGAGDPCPSSDSESDDFDGSGSESSPSDGSDADSDATDVARSGDSGGRGRVTGAPTRSPFVAAPWDVSRRVRLRYRFTQRLVGRSDARRSTWRAYDLKRRAFVAITRVAGAFASDARARRTVREVSVLLAMRGQKHVVQLLDLDVLNSRDVILVMEHATSNLADYLVKLRKDKRLARLFTLQWLRHFVGQLLSALSTLARAGIVHRDIKPSNILIFDGGAAGEATALKLAGFNSVKVVGEVIGDADASELLCGPTNRTIGHVFPYFRAPELIYGVGGRYTGKSDVWSAGCVMAELFSIIGSVGVVSASSALVPGIFSIRGNMPHLDAQRQLVAMAALTGWSPLRESEDSTAWLREQVGARAAEQLVATIPPDGRATGALARCVEGFADVARAEQCLHLVTACLQMLVGDRIGAEDAVRHTFVPRYVRTELDGATAPRWVPSLTAVSEFDLNSGQCRVLFTYMFAVFHRDIDALRMSQRCAARVGLSPDLFTETTVLRGIAAGDASTAEKAVGGAGGGQVEISSM